MGQELIYSLLSAFGPCSAHLLSKVTGNSKGSVSEALRRLQNWGEAEQMKGYKNYGIWVTK